MFSIYFAILFVLAHIPLILTCIHFQAHVKSSNQGLAQARCPSFPLPFQSEFLSQLPLNCLFVPMLLLGSIHQNVFTCPKHAMLKQINFYGFSSRSAIFKHPNKKGFNFPSSQYLLLPLSLGTLWMRRGHCNENISIRCPLSLWKCLSQCVAL